ncbi:MAG: sigma-54-dependent Fis family transcriptional regulator, partial [Deltaproteobacteria bacterium]|nr:sigma-54-dependent Fis family transcriptional regulator [Deltaproteobacteria bacterium]
MEQFNASILIVEDEDIARRNLEYILKKEGYSVKALDSGLKALGVLEKESFDLVITDLKMEKVDGIQVLKKSRELQPHTEVIMITGYATVDSAVQAMKEGAYHYIAKPYNIEEVRQIAREALLKRKLLQENLALKESLKKSQLIPEIIGKSEAIITVKKTIQQVAPSDSNVLISGESGTGKELVAKAIHQLSPRSNRRFIAFNCGSFTEELMASELFGHEKDAFTGATRQKAGLLEAADGGTVFLDEIGDMPPSMQVKLLRVMQEKELLRVGGTEMIPVDVRYIAATHRDLKDDVEKGFFRQDLFYRITVIAILLPALTAR